MPHNQPDRETIRERVASLPLAEHGEPINEETALAILEDLRRNGSVIPEHLLYQAYRITLSVQREYLELEEQEGKPLEQDPSHQYYHLSSVMIRGIVAKAVYAGAGQVISDEGEEMIQIRNLERMMTQGQDPETPESDQNPGA